MTSLLCRRTGSHQFLCIILATLTAFGPVAAQAQTVAPPPKHAAEPEATATPAVSALNYVTPGACVVVAMRPKQLFTSPAAEMFPNEVLQAALTTTTGINPLNVEEAVISWSPPANYAIYIRSNDRVTLKEGEVTRHTSPGTLNGKAYLKSGDHFEPSFYAPDERSLLAAPDFILSQLVAEKPAPRPDVLKNFDGERAADDLHAAVNMAMLRPIIAMAMWNAEIPKDFAAIRDIPGMISTIDLRLNISNPAPTELVVTANHAADANRLQTTFETLKRKAIDQIDREMSKDLTGDDPVQQATRAYQRRVNERIYNSLKIEQEDNKLVVFRTENAGREGSEAVSVATIGILIALLLPAVQAARAAARRNTAINNMKQLNLSLLNYESAYGAFPPRATFDDDGKPLLSWRVHLLPFLEQNELYEQFHLDEPWDSDHNKTLIAKMPEIFRDPVSQHAVTDGKSNYLGVLGEGMFFESVGEGRTFEMIEDGLSRSIALVQVDDAHAETWTKPADWSPDAQNNLLGLGGLHLNIFLASFCDGSVQAISNAVDGDEFQAFLTINGGE